MTQIWGMMAIGASMYLLQPSQKRKQSQSIRSAIEPLELRRLLTALTWTGDVDGNWNTNSSGNTNWSGEVLPINGDTLIFPAAAANKSNTNNLTGLSLALIQFDGVNYTIAGNTLAVDGITMSSSLTTSNTSNTISTPITQNTTLTVDTQSAATVVTLALSGVLSGTMNVVKNGIGYLSLTGSSPNTHTGAVTVNGGRLGLNKNQGPLAPGFISIPGDLYVNNATVHAAWSGQFADTAAVSLVNSTLSGGSIGFGDIFGSVTLENSTIDNGGTGSGYTTAGDITISASSTAASIIKGVRFGSQNGVLNLNGKTLNINTGIYSPSGMTINGNGTVNVEAIAAVGNDNGFSQINGNVVLTYNNSTTTSLTVPVGSTFITGTGTGGGGTIGDMVGHGLISLKNISNNVYIGKLNTKNLTLDGTYRLSISQPAPPYMGSISTTGTVTLNNPTLNANYFPFMGNPSNPFTIIQNDGTDAVVGTFNGLPEGTIIPLNGSYFKISYVGGTGNDVTLTWYTYPTTFSGTSGDDNITLNVSGSNYEVWTNGFLTSTIPQSATTGLTFNAGGGIDTFKIKGSGPSDAINLAAGTFTESGKTFTFTSAESLQLETGQFTVSADLGAIGLQVNNATATLIQTQNLASLNIIGGATVTSASTNATAPAIKAASVMIDNATLHIAANGGLSGVSEFNSLSLIGTGKIDLHNNDLVINYGINASPYTQIFSQVKDGLTLLGGTGSHGIGSTEVDAQTPGGTILAVVDDGDAILAGAITSTSGFTLTNPSSSIIIKYTWFGDSNLDGVVNGGDYALADTGFTSGGSLTGWVFGDYNGDGITDGSDYALLDTGFISQNGVIL